MYIGTPLNDRRHRTLCRVDGQLCWFFLDNGDGTVRIEWFADQGDADREQARVAGLLPANEAAGNVEISAERIERPFLHAEDEQGEMWRHLPGPAMFGAPVEPTLRPDAAGGLARALDEWLTEGRQEIRLDCQVLGTRLEVIGTVVTGSGEQPWIPSEEIVEWVRRVRVSAYTPSEGPWTTARFQLVSGGELSVETGRSEPEWQYSRPEPPEQLQETHDEDFREFYDELKYFPRDRSAVPGWLLESAWKYQARQREFERARFESPQAGRNFGAHQYGARLAETFDGRGDADKPTAYRPALPWSEKQPVLDYLMRGHLVLAAQSTSEDLLAPDRPPQVPNLWVTDGLWVWPSAMAYYLDVHNITPPLEFLDHIRAADYRVPDAVADQARERAKAAVMGVEGGGLPSSEAQDTVQMVKQVVAGLRISKRRYTFDAAREGAWSMLLEPDGWWSVFYTKADERTEEARFHQAMDAAAHMVGCLTLQQEQLRREPDEVLEDYECLLLPLVSDPPLSTYESKLHVELAAGTEVDRFGDTDGNTVFVAGTTMPQRVVSAGQHPGTYHRYRALTSFQVVTGTAKSSNGQVGGGVAYVLPQPVADLVAGGWFAEL